MHLPGRNADLCRSAGRQPTHLACLRRRNGRRDRQPGAASIPAPKKSKRWRRAATPRGSDPFVYFHSLLDLGDCSADDLPLGRLSADLRKAEKTPSFSFIAPTLCNLGATGQCATGATEGPAAADAFLSTWVPKILASPAYKADGLLIVNFAAVNPPIATPEGAPAPVPAGDPLHLGALLLSPFLAPGSTDAAPYDPYSILRSNEDLFGFDPLGLAGASQDEVIRAKPAQRKRRRLAGAPGWKHQGRDNSSGSPARGGQ